MTSTRSLNRSPETGIDDRLRASGWHVQDRNAIDFNAGVGIAIREYQTDIGPADYVLFADRQPVGVVEAKPDSWGARLTTVELQSEGYANAKLKWVSNAEPLPFVYESTGQVTRFTNGRDPNPRSREVFTFHRPETLRKARLFPRAAPVYDRVRPDCAYIHRELKRDGVTLQLLWEEYAQVHPNGYRHTQFCEIYRQWAKRLRPSMRQVHRAGEKTFIDFSGKRPTLVDRRTGELRPVELFVAVPS